MIEPELWKTAELGVVRDSVLVPRDPTTLMTEFDEAIKIADGIELATSLDGNPYLDTFLELSGGLYRENWHTLPYDGKRSMALQRARERLTPWYSWAVPDRRAIELVGATGKVVEIGAGGGYWAGLLRADGVEVFAYDSDPLGNHWVEKLWSPVEVGGPSDAALHPDATLFLCWPPYGSRMATVALYRYLRAGGRRLAYVGEILGCCADDGFFDALDEMEQVEEYDIPQFWGVHDYLSVYELR